MRALGRYRLEREIGRGGMGTVFLARDPFLDRPVALKVMERDGALGRRIDPDIYEGLFFNETRAAAVLHHPNIVRVFDAGIEGDAYYVAMEYVAGGHTLDRHCQPGALLPADRVAEVVFKCAEALEYAHQKGVIHRDIKPANILLGENGSVKLADFSIALLEDPHLVDTQVTLPAGSPLYMSPEQVREQALNHQSDLFSLGVVLYELLTGHHPFVAGTLAAVTHRILNEDPAPLARYRAGLPETFQHIVDRALAKDRRRRYARAFDFAADLGQVFSALRHPQDGITTEGRADTLRRLDFFHRFPDAEIWELLRWAEWLEHVDGDAIVTEGDEGDACYIVVQGEVVVRKGEREIAVLKAGECFGEIGYLTRQPRTASVIARGPATVLRINASLIDRASESCQLHFQREFIAILTQRLVETTGLLAAR